MDSSNPGGDAVAVIAANGAASQAGAGSATLAPVAGREQRALAAASIGVWEYQADQRRFLIDQTVQRLLGLGGGDQTEGDVLAAIAAQDRGRVREALHAAAVQGCGFDEMFQVAVAGETRWLHSIGQAAASDGPSRLIGVSFDATAEGRALAARDLLLREMNHRIKNLFAVIGGLVSLCAREAQTPRDLADDLGTRIAAMGRAHSLTQQTMVERALDLHELVEAVIEPARIGQSILIEGDAIHVPIALVTPLALIFHEWATNAAKYGALADPAGTLAVRWTVDDAGLTTIVWHETCAKAPGANPGQPGFGTRLIEATVAQLRARLTGEQGEGVLLRRLEVAGLGLPR